MPSIVKASPRNKAFIWIVLVLLILLGFTSSLVLPIEPLEGIRSLADGKRFNYFSWTLEALFNKAVSASLKAEKFLPASDQVNLVESYFKQVGLVEQSERALGSVYSAPGQKLNERAIEMAKAELNEAAIRMKKLAPLTEAVIQNQTEATLLAMGFGVGGQIFPPVLYQVSDLPLNLIVSPRDEITTLLSPSLKPGMDVLEKDRIEKTILEKYKHSGLIEEVGGVGTYPTMVMRSNNIHWLTETVAHEWIHNYLSLRPLGVRYFQNNAMRTINETTASLSGKEIGRGVIAIFYPHRIVIGHKPFREMTWVPRFEETDLIHFDFRHEMHKTRLVVDDLLALGKVEEAEEYMEMRREAFWDAGYHIRKINQAYFAFYGSYNDTPGGGASGKDPIGPAVRALRYSFKRLKPFIDTIQSVRNFEDLMKIAPKP